MTKTSRTATFQGQTFDAVRKNSKFMSFYTRNGGETFLTVEHTSEAAAIKGSWQSAGMKKVWAYAGYAPIVEG